MPRVGGEIPPGRSVRYGVGGWGDTTRDKGTVCRGWVARYHQGTKVQYAGGGW